MLLGCLHAGCFIYLFFPFPFLFSVGYCRSLPLPCSSYRAIEARRWKEWRHRWRTGTAPVSLLLHRQSRLPLFFCISPTSFRCANRPLSRRFQATTRLNHSTRLPEMPTKCCHCMDRGNESHARFSSIVYFHITAPHSCTYHALVIITWSFGRLFTFETMAPISMLSSGLHAPSSLNHQSCFTVA